MALITLGKIKKLFRPDKLDEDFFESLEDSLIEGDVSAKIAFDAVEKLREQSAKEKLSDFSDLQYALKEILKTNIAAYEFDINPDELNTILVLGVNGVGKTTTIAKMGHYFREEKGFEGVVLATGDTFRAAAIEQLEIHGRRNNFRVVAQKTGADPGAVIYDALESARARNEFLVLADTAGRMHNKKNLVRELQKIDKIIRNRVSSRAYIRVLVIDATTGQNGLLQAETFQEALGIDTIVLTKYDSAAKGGTVLSIGHNLNIPFSFIGCGEKMDDLIPFNPDKFLNNFLGIE